jgi:hypothetical protein
MFFMPHEVQSAKDISNWIGGFFFWVIKGFKGRLSDYYSEQTQKRNVLIGYIIQVIILITCVYFFLVRNIS